MGLEGDSGLKSRICKIAQSGRDARACDGSGCAAALVALYGVSGVCRWASSAVEVKSKSQGGNNQRNRMHGRSGQKYSVRATLDGRSEGVARAVRLLLVVVVCGRRRKKEMKSWFTFGGRGVGLTALGGLLEGD
jgi:hypothetical protein